MVRLSPDVEGSKVSALDFKVTVTDIIHSKLKRIIVAENQELLYRDQLIAFRHMRAGCALSSTMVRLRVRLSF